MEEGLIEIDPEFYFNCRLCLEQTGKFTISPNMQKRIKFAFDINIQLGDGFSQIMCEKCKAIVIEMAATKEKFLAKQADMQRGKSKHSKADQEDGDVTEVPVVEETPVIAESARNGKSESDRAPSVSSRSSACSKKRKRVKKAKRKVVRTISSSSSEIQVTEEHIHSESDQDVHVEIEKNEPVSLSWKELYYRSYVCRYCNLVVTFKKSIKDHVQTHNRLVKKRHKVSRWHAVVKLERFDERANLTGSDDIVVFSQKKLCTNDENADYFILYTPKGTEANCSLEPPNSRYIEPSLNLSGSDSESRSNRKRFTCIDVTSEGEETLKPKLRKRIRLQSSGSGDTVDLQNNAPPDSNSDTLNVDDSSNDLYEPLTEIQQNKEPPPSYKCEVKRNTPENVYSTIKQIVSISIASMKKKKTKVIVQPKENIARSLSTDELMKRKLLSIGRKTIGKQGFLSMGLLTVLQQRDLKIQWVKDSNSKDSMVRIFTKLSTGSTNNLIGFQPCVELEDGIKETDAERSLRTGTWRLPSQNVKTKTTSKSKSKTTIPPKPLVVSPLIPSVATVPLHTFPTASPLLPTVSPLLPTVSSLLPSPTVLSSLPSVIPLLPALPYTTLTRNTPVSVAASATASPVSPVLLNILNASPVANPKMAPKKKVSLLKTELPKQIAHTDHDYNGESITLDSDDDTANVSQKELSMPDISPQSNLDKPVFSPDLKAKSYISRTLLVTSSSPCLPIITATTSLANIPENIPSKESLEERKENLKIPRIKCKPVSELMGNKIIITPVVTPGDHSTVLANPGETESSPAISSNIPPGNIVLHTITLPNTITKSPFDYFSRLLRMHTIYLLDSLAPTELEFATLVKFKLGVHQHPLSVMLCLTLEANGSMFRITIKNKANEDVDVASMTALWQWEVLKAFNSESVITRIKQAAEREAVVTVNQANLFIGLLSSIKLLDQNVSDASAKQIVPSLNL